MEWDGMKWNKLMFLCLDWFFFLTIKNGTYILTNEGNSLVQGVPRRPQIITESKQN